ncbi:uncharacterized protein BO95DRAFT_447791 [Aspergillus brunneoviolaceus CBS 621.78]|uniref:Uncharacterized protein n=1 Tax=Aspergillus brunneoviolaceus CBS 621.78 TaxID=1450534 RepID=A0ACD1FUA1_9EURO|nr:hypothetical protein BO95DRAFT_447791 [Aspergillus brunneoviolaceus CBS 621.78]RAH40533.1 hypothetical protein BO95DRAFT_447791 [Aspergillus brunneoviolaceus CBS 621.78]
MNILPMRIKDEGRLVGALLASHQLPVLAQNTMEDRTTQLPSTLVDGPSTHAIQYRTDIQISEVTREDTPGWKWTSFRFPHGSAALSPSLDVDRRMEPWIGLFGAGRYVDT